MANISLTLYTNGFFGSFLKSPTQMGSLSINNSVTNISRLGTFNQLSRGWDAMQESTQRPTKCGSFIMYVHLLPKNFGSEHTDKKETKYKEIQVVSGAKSYMRKGFLIYEEMRNFFPTYEEAVSHICMTLHPIPLNFLIHEKILLSFYRCTYLIN
jgi:hypothetical protein